jgi:hypothetical protein
VSVTATVTGASDRDTFTPTSDPSLVGHCCVRAGPALAIGTATVIDAATSAVASRIRLNTAAP